MTSPGRVEPLWHWAHQEADRPVLTVGGRPSVAAGELLRSVRQLELGMSSAGLAPGDWLLIAESNPQSMIEALLAASRRGITGVLSPGLPDPNQLSALRAHPRIRGAVLPDRRIRRFSGSVPCSVPGSGAAPCDDPDRTPAGAVLSLADAVAGVVPREPTMSVNAASRSAALFADVLDCTPGGTVLVGLPPAAPLTAWLIGGLIHSRRHVVIPDRLSFDSIGRELDSNRVCDVVVSAESLPFLVDTGTICARHQQLRRVLSIGAGPSAALREKLRAQLGRDLLVEYGADAGSIAWLDAPADTEACGFWSWSRARPEDPAVVTEDGHVVSSGELRHRVDVLAAAMMRRSLTVVACLLDSDVDVLVTYLAACKAGAEVIPLDPRSPAEELAHLIDSGGAQLTVSGHRLAARLPSTCPVATLGELVLPAEAPDPDPAHRHAGGIRGYTSGTTGPAKIVIRAAARYGPELLAAYERSWVRQLGVVGQGTHLVTMPLYQLAALGFASSALHAGQTLLFMGQWAPKRALELMTRHAVTTTFMAPPMLESLLSLRSSSTTSTPTALRAVVHATAAVSVDTKQAMLDWWGPVLYEYYGAAELYGTYATPEEWRTRPGTVGRPVPGVDVAILDEQGNRCPPRMVGEVFLTDSGFRYRGSDAAPHARLGSLASVGDLGYVDDDGWLFLTGRATDYINVGGRKFSPTGVEAVIRGVPGVVDCAVVGVAQRQFGQVPVAVVVVRPPLHSQPEAARAVLRHARAHLPPSQVPTRVVVVDALPRDGYGALRRSELRRMLTDRRPGTSALRPSSDLEPNVHRRSDD